MEAKLVAFLKRPPVLQIKDGVAHVVDDDGDNRIDRAMSVKTLAKYLERGRRALQQHADGVENVIVDD